MKTRPSLAGPRPRAPKRQVRRPDSHPTTPEELRRAPRNPLPEHGSVRHLEDIEREYILAALVANEGNQTRSAEQLHIGSATLYRKLKRYRLDKPH